MPAIYSNFKNCRSYIYFSWNIFILDTFPTKARTMIIAKFYSLWTFERYHKNGLKRTRPKALYVQ